MVKRLETSPHDPLGITDSACKNQLVVVSVQYGPFYTYIRIRSTTIGKSRVAIDPMAMHTSWRSNSDIMSVTRRLAPTSFTRKSALQTVGGGRSSIRSTTRSTNPSSACTRGLKNSTRMESPLRGDRNKSDHVNGGTRRRHGAAQGGGRLGRVGEEGGG
ncbi:hypothetical protein F511_26682 [Dorcoceras hygrometricum]|uniref:Uncharacterized protein n=1 Tax=Dorcoceras hygrometricum TaxID=472368 RepID=A0A2Z7CEN2_9LAMI|nr:hypothetical protein F511_26682 [Dorcoceras hygrometricum]